MMRGVEALISQDFIERVPPDVVRVVHCSRKLDDIFLRRR